MSGEGARSPDRPQALPTSGLHEAHGFELTTAAGAAIEGANVILESGAGLERWLDDAIVTIEYRTRGGDTGLSVAGRGP